MITWIYRCTLISEFAYICVQTGKLSFVIPAAATADGGRPEPEAAIMINPRQKQIILLSAAACGLVALLVVIILPMSFNGVEYFEVGWHSAQ